MTDRHDRRIDLAREGRILFFGTMNAAPMTYARELRRMGQDVTYFVDVPETDTLSRPENHFPDIDYPYPSWIVEFRLATQILVYAAPRVILRRMLRKAGISAGSVKAVVLSGPFIRFAPLFSTEIPRIFFSYGSDLDVWCNVPNAHRLAEGMRGLSVFRVLPAPAVRRLVPAIVRGNFASAARCDFLLYFPKQISPAGAPIVEALESAGVRYVPRYDASFDQLSGVDRAFKPPGEKLVIFSPVRFLYRTFNEGVEQYSKGNDVILKGVALYRSEFPAVELHLVEKGEDVEHARGLAVSLNLGDTVRWHREMQFKRLIDLYLRCDVCIDQVGRHWMGAVGMFALWLGRPVIANVRNLAFLGEMPILQAETPEEIRDNLVRLSDVRFRRRLSNQSMRFAEEKLTARQALSKFVRGAPVGAGN